MNPDPKILFLYSAPRGGHKSCADAIRATFKNLYGDSIQTAGQDISSSLSPILGPLVTRTYFEMLRLTPQIWNFIYDNPDIEQATRELRRFFNSLNGSKLTEFIRKHRPSALVCTHALPCGVAAEQKKKGICSLPLIAVITDFAVHRYWTCPEVDLFIVSNKQSEKTLRSRGIPQRKIKIFGIPTSATAKTNPDDAKRKLGLDPSKPCVMLMGGTRIRAHPRTCTRPSFHPPVSTGHRRAGSTKI